MYQISYSEEELNKWRSFFIHFMDRLDKLRKLHWHKFFPELYKSTLGWRKLKPSQYMEPIEYA